MNKYIAYLRVSTKRQGQSGLGLEAQRESIRTYVERNGGEIIAEFVEVKSGTSR
ncbi:MAG TPA: recombinase family protein, partial [Cyclobacteriaceae bacterium]|nr:recombinase family protein [Cyclobacteriaceae bacterium]